MWKLLTSVGLSLTLFYTAAYGTHMPVKPVSSVCSTMPGAGFDAGC